MCDALRDTTATVDAPARLVEGLDEHASGAASLVACTSLVGDVSSKQSPLSAFEFCDISICTSQGELITTLSGMPTNTAIVEIKKKIHQVIGMRLECQYLSTGGNELYDNSFLSSYVLAPGNAIQLSAQRHQWSHGLVNSKGRGRRRKK